MGNHINQKWLFVGLGAMFTVGVAFSISALTGTFDGFRQPTYDARPSITPIQPQPIPNQKKQQITLVSKMAVGLSNSTSQSASLGGEFQAVREVPSSNKSVFELKLRYEPQNELPQLPINIAPMKKFPDGGYFEHEWYYFTYAIPKELCKYQYSLAKKSKEPLCNKYPELISISKTIPTPQAGEFVLLGQAGEMVPTAKDSPRLRYVTFGTMDEKKYIRFNGFNEKQQSIMETYVKMKSFLTYTPKHPDVDDGICKIKHKDNIYYENMEDKCLLLTHQYVDVITEVDEKGFIRITDIKPHYEKSAVGYSKEKNTETGNPIQKSSSELYSYGDEAIADEKRMNESLPQLQACVQTKAEDACRIESLKQYNKSLVTSES